MSAVAADTHAVVWWLSDPARLSVGAKAAFHAATTSGARIYVPSVSLVECRYLVEKGKLAAATLKLLISELDDPATVLKLVPLDRAAALAVERIARADVPDMPDRIIAATALALGVPLVTRDGKIRTAGIHTIW